MSNSDRGRRRGAMDSASLWQLTGMGFQLVAEVLAGALLGWLLDWALGTGPWFLLIGALLGVIVAMTNFIRQALKLGAANTGRSASRESTEDKDRSSSQ